MTKRRILNETPFYVAVHEAGHAVAGWSTGTRFRFVHLRTQEEVLAGPYLDDRGREVDCIGGVEGSDRYHPLSLLYSDPSLRLDDMEVGNCSAEDLLALKTTWRANAEIDIIISMAGPVAEARYRHFSLTATYFLGGAGDIEKIRPRLDYLTRTEAERTRLEVDLEARTRRMFREPSVWDAVLAVADELRARRKLEWNDVLKIVRRVTGQDKRPYDWLLPKQTC